MSAVAAPRIALSGHDLYLFREGTHSRLYEKLGAHLVEGATEFTLPRLGPYGVVDLPAVK